MEERRRQAAEDLLQRRAEYKEKTKNAVAFTEMPPEMKPKKGRGRKGGQDGDILSSSGSEGEAGPSEQREKKPKWVPVRFLQY